MSESESIISLRGLTKRFGASTVAVDRVDLDIREGEFFALLGPSGCGKTTLLRMLAGLEMPSEGELLIDDRDMAGVAPNRRPVNMVFQSYAVFPHMNVEDNVAYGLKVTGTPRDEARTRVREALELVQLGGFGKRRPDQLSGGQRQRVALARALVKQPRVLLLDEPLSALDAKLREAMQLELVRLQHAVGITFVIVTHDQDEALSVADRVAVMNEGRVCQLAPPRELYERPSSRFVADFIGKMNLYKGTIHAAPDGAPGTVMVDVEGVGQLTLPPGNDYHALPPGGETGIAVRPEKVRLHGERPAGGGFAVQASVQNVAYHGAESHVYLVTEAGARIAATVPNATRDARLMSAGEQRWVSWSPHDTLVLLD
ncbi:MAG: ABC transporter ATP-binding protein [Gammaproteobacteria bacterium]